MANTLSKNQIEYFKNSKVRDKNGNLIVCYHGTQTPGFTEFNPQHSNTSQFGKYKFDKYNVNYFTSDIDVARGYTELGVGDVEGERKNIYACYLNIENPFIVDNKTESEFKKWSNIKDNRVRDKHIEAFEKFAKKWLHTWVDDSDVNAINKDLHFFNHELRPCADVDQDEDAIIYDLWELGNNSFFGAEHEVMRYYYIEELFSEDNYEELRDCLVGNYEEDREDYYYTIDNIVRWVLLMNEEDGTNYDGIIVPDIADVGPKGNPFSPYCTDYITLKSSNQIKDIRNINPTSRSNIHEDAGEKQIKIFKQIYNKIIQAEKYYGTPQWKDLLFSPLHCFIGAVLYAYHYSYKEKQPCIFHLGSFDNTATIISHCWIEDSAGRIHDTRGMSDKNRYTSFIEIPIDSNTDALSIIRLVKAVVERKALIEELKESEIENMNINEALKKLNNLDESLLQDLHRDNQHVKKIYGEEVYQALQEYCEQGNDLGNVLYTESGWKRFEKWLFNTKGINIKEPNDYQILEARNELKDRAKKHKKTNKKGAKGWFVNPNAGDVEYNIGFFNHAMGSDGGTLGTSGGASDGGGMGESLQEAISNNVKIYETEKDGLPEVGRKFIAYRTTHKEYEIYTRQDKEDIRKQGWSDVDSRISKDGEFYSGKSGWIYPVDYDRYVYLDELKLISPKTTKQDQLKQENVTKEIKTAFNEVFGTFGDKLATAFTIKNEKGDVEVEFPFSVWNNTLSINYLAFENEHKINRLLIEPMKSNNLNDADIEKIFNIIFSYKWENYYIRKELAKYKQTALDRFTHQDKKESLNGNLNENNEVEEQGKNSRYFDIEVALRKADLNYNYDYDSKFYFESKSDLEKACHLVRELGYEKYDRHESDLCLYINPELKEDFEDLDNPYADDIQKFVYKAISALNLRSRAARDYYAEMLEHDIRNLRGDEWFEIFDKPRYASILAELKELINYKEDVEENLKKNSNENQSLVSFYHSSNNPNLTYDNLDWNKSSEIGLHIGTKQAAIERNNTYFYEIIVDKDKMKIFKAPYDMNHWYTVELAKKIKDETLFEEISNILYSYIHDREEDRFLESSKAYRDYFFKKGINTISYQNDYEDVESESYILLDKSMIVDVKPKGQTNEQLDESIEKHPTLNPLLWDENKKLIPIVNKTLNKIVKAFVDYCAESDVKLNVKDSVIVGSNANYNYTKDSDIDLHLIIDFDDEEQYKLYDAYKRLFNDKYDLTIKDIPVEIYIEKDLNSINSNGIYSLQDGWLKEPVQKEIPDIDEEKLEIELDKYLNKYKNIKPENAESLIDLLYELRQKALSKQGEYAIGNLIFKEFRNRGYLDKLKDLRDKYTSSILSLA